MHMRDHFTRVQDWSLVAEIDSQLERYGVAVVGRLPDETPRYERVVNPKVPANRKL